MVILTVDSSDTDGSERISTHGRTFAEVEEFLAENDSVSVSAIKKIRFQAYQTEVTLASGGTNDNVQVTTGGSLRTSDTSDVVVTTSTAVVGVVINYMVMPKKTA